MTAEPLLWCARSHKHSSSERGWERARGSPAQCTGGPATAPEGGAQRREMRAKKAQLVGVFVLGIVSASCACDCLSLVCLLAQGPLIVTDAELSSTNSGAVHPTRRAAENAAHIPFVPGSSLLTTAPPSSLSPLCPILLQHFYSVHRYAPSLFSLLRITFLVLSEGLFRWFHFLVSCTALFFLLFSLPRVQCS